MYTYDITVITFDPNIQLTHTRTLCCHIRPCSLHSKGHAPVWYEVLKVITLALISIHPSQYCLPPSFYTIPTFPILNEIYFNTFTCLYMYNTHRYTWIIIHVCWLLNTIILCLHTHTCVYVYMLYNTAERCYIICILCICIYI